MTRRTLLGVLAVLIGTGSLWAQDDGRVLLRYHWNPGEEIVWDLTTETTATMTMRDLTKEPVEENVMSTWSRVLTSMNLVVESVDEDGNATLSYEMGVMEMDVETEGQQQFIRIDPQAGTMTVNGEPAPLPGDALLGMAGPIRMVISHRGELMDIDAPEGFGALMGTPGMDWEQWMMMSQGWAASFPEEPIGIGHVWGGSTASPVISETDAEDAPAPAGEVAMLYRLLDSRIVNGVECAQIEMLGMLDFETLPMPGVDAMTRPGGAPERLEVTTGPMHASISGTIDFDAVGGRLIASDAVVIVDMTQRMKGTLEAPPGHEDVKVDMEMITRNLKVEVRMEVAK